MAEPEPQVQEEPVEETPKGKITSDNIAAVLGLDPIKTQLQAWWEITGRESESKLSEFEMSKERAKRRGKMLKRECIEYGREELQILHACDVFVVEVSPTARDEPWITDVRSSGYMFSDGKTILANPKTISGAENYHRKWGTPNTDQVADNVLLQDVWRMICHPASDEVLNPALIGGWKFEFQWWLVRRDKELEDIVLEKAHKWYEDHIVKNQAPAAAAGDARLLSRLYRGRESELKTEMDIVEIAIRADALSKEGERMKEDAEKLRLRIREHMKDHTLMKWGKDRKITLPQAKKVPKVNWQRVAAELAAKLPLEESQKIIKQFTYEETTTRALSIKISGAEP